jgi:spore coat polysaccharide biosynthesis protein SpsF (cytidylyltransferase family)
MILAIIQARMGSSRLPGKVLRPVDGKPMLGIMCGRVLKSRLIDQLAIATTTESSDDGVERLAESMGLPCHRGSVDDVLERFSEAADRFGSGREATLIRLTGDCPYMDPALIDEMMEEFGRLKCDYYSNTFDCTYPDGQDIEIFTKAALERADREANMKSQREHLTQYIKYHGGFKTENKKYAVDFSHLRFTVDEEADFELFKRVYEHFSSQGNPHFKWMEVVALLTKHPDWLSLNSNFKRDEGLAKSLSEERIVT